MITDTIKHMANIANRTYIAHCGYTKNSHIRGTQVSISNVPENKKNLNCQMTSYQNDNI